MAACSSTSASGIRNRALIALLYRSGLRLSEALDLYPKDVDFGRGAIRVLNGKGGKSRVSGIDPGALAILQRWVEVRANFGHNGSKPLFCTASGERVSNAYIRRLFPITLLSRRQSLFPKASCSITLSRLKSATRRLSFRFSSSSCFRRRTSATPIPMYFRFHR
jgi:site-specific recombinase XerC